MSALDDAAARAEGLYGHAGLRRAYLDGVRAREAGAPFDAPYRVAGWGASYRKAWERGYREARDGVVAAPGAGFP